MTEQVCMNYILRKLDKIKRYPDDIYDIEYVVTAPDTMARQIKRQRAIPYNDLAAEIVKKVKVIEAENKYHIGPIGIYQNPEYTSDLCVIMYIL